MCMETFLSSGKKTKQVNTQNLIRFMKNAFWLVFFYTIVHMLVCWPLQNHSELLCKLSASYHPQTANNQHPQTGQKAHDLCK